MLNAMIKNGLIAYSLVDNTVAVGPGTETLVFPLRVGDTLSKDLAVALYWQNNVRRQVIVPYSLISFEGMDAEDPIRIDPAARDALTFCLACGELGDDRHKCPPVWLVSPIFQFKSIAYSELKDQQAFTDHVFARTVGEAAAEFVRTTPIDIRYWVFANCITVYVWREHLQDEAVPVQVYLPNVWSPDQMALWDKGRLAQQS